MFLLLTASLNGDSCRWSVPLDLTIRDRAHAAETLRAGILSSAFSQHHTEIHKAIFVQAQPVTHR